MSTAIYLIRHGESKANAKGIFLGQQNMELTETGRQQAQKTAAYFKKQAIRPDAIYSSDLIRAYDTARSTAECMNLPIVEEKALREINAGKWENVPFTELLTRFPGNYRLWMENIGLAQCDDGESVMQLQQRIVAAVRRLAQAHEGGTIFLFTHATPIRSFATYCMGKSMGEMKNVPWPTNASVTKVLYQDGAFQMLEYSRDDFMGELVTELPSDV